MKNLFKFEFRKVFLGVSFYVLLAVALAAPLLVIGFTTLLAKEFGGSLTATYNDLYFSTVCLVISYLWIVICVYSCLYLTKDYSNGTIKNIYARGFSREAYFFVRVIVITVASIAIFLAFHLFTYLFSSIACNQFKLEKVSDAFVYIGYEALGCICMTTFSVFVCSFIKKNGGAIATTILAPSVLSLFVTLGDALIMSNAKKDVESVFQLSNYYFYSYLDSGLLSTNETVCSIEIGSKNVPTMILTLIVTSIAFLAFAYLIGRRDEV